MLSQTSMYALRAVTYVARHAKARPVLAKDISADMDIPLKYLQKLLSDLVRTGVLRSTRGIGGGFQLSESASRLSLAGVIEPFDDIGRRAGCPFGNRFCKARASCPIHDRWQPVVDAYRAFLETTKVGDLAASDP